jgi:diguanylate cyclase (GGDEF)-like protein
MSQLVETWNPAVLEDLHALLEEVGSGPVGEEIEPQVRGLEEDHGDVIYAELVYLLSHLRFPVEQAKSHWERIVEHRRSMQERLGTAVDLRVALVSYFVEVNRQIKNPKVIEMQLFESERASAYRDELTGLYNYRMFREQLEREFARTSDRALPLSLMMVDVDDFKEYNDANGHETGNRALAAVARAIEGVQRESDLSARYGGEEFALILPATTKTEAQAVAEQLRLAIERLRFEGECRIAAGELTVSIGVATHPADGEQPTDLVRQADQALYLAKAAGRNRVVLYGQSRRSYGRVQAELAGSFRTLADSAHALTTVNFSEGGLLFLSEHAPAVDSLIELQLGTDREQIVKALGQVVSVEADGAGGFRTAVRITAARKVDRARIMRLVRQKNL